MSAPTDRVLDALRARKVTPRRTGKGWQSRCPAHEDRKPSLSIGEGHDGRALVTCHAGCAREAIVAALGLTFADLMPEREREPARSPRATRKRPKAEGARAFATAEDAVRALERQLGPRVGLWTYVDATGTPVGLVVRFESSEGKTFRPVSVDEAGRWHLRGMPAPRPLYRLTDVLGAARVYVCEGEKAADAARRLGWVSTTSANGAGGAKHSDWGVLAGKDVVILPDNNEAGEKYAADVVELIAATARSVRVVRLPGLAEGGDIADLVDEQATDLAQLRAEIERLADESSLESVPALARDERGPILVNLADVTSTSVSWLWPGRIPFGKLSMLVGDPGRGKSFLTLDIAARVTRGADWPDGAGSCGDPGGVVLVNVEDDLADTIRPRLDAARADVSRIRAFNEVGVGKGKRRPFVLADLPDLERAILSTPECRLVVIDPLGAFLAGIDSHNNAEVRGLLAPLSMLAARHGVALVIVGHLNKGSGPAMYRATGSLAFTAAARAVWVACDDPDDPDKGRRHLLPVKNNLADDTSGLAYTIGPMEAGGAAVVRWEREPVRVSADEALAFTPPDGNRRRERDEAEDFLREVLADGPRPAKEVEALAKGEGISRSTLRRARERLCAKPEKVGKDYWEWALRPEGAQSP